ncbi:MAG: response regulator transcription factor, partial [Gaiellaceae bacterium]
MPDSSTILLVDDEDAVQKLLAYPLERDGFRVLQARDGQEALERFEREHVDLVVLDVMLPKLDGLEVCKRLRAASAVPIIMLTARDDELDKVLGLELGADDYITKPFSIREFRSRVRALLRRAAAAPLGPERGADDYNTKPFSIREFRSRVRALLRRAATAPPGSDEEVIRNNELTIDLARREVSTSGRVVQLTYVEFELLRTLASHAGRVYTREQLLQAL